LPQTIPDQLSKLKLEQLGLMDTTWVGQKERLKALLPNCKVGFPGS
jgi:hypothetical protein